LIEHQKLDRFLTFFTPFFKEARRESVLKPIEPAAGQRRVQVTKDYQR